MGVFSLEWILDFWGSYNYPIIYLGSRGKYHCFSRHLFHQQFQGKLFLGWSAWLIKRSRNQNQGIHGKGGIKDGCCFSTPKTSGCFLGGIWFIPRNEQWLKPWKFAFVREKSHVFCYTSYVFKRKFQHLRWCVALQFLVNYLKQIYQSIYNPRKGTAGHQKVRRVKAGKSELRKTFNF